MIGPFSKIRYEDNPKNDGMNRSLTLLGRKWACKLGGTKCRAAATAQLKNYTKTDKLNT